MKKKHKIAFFLFIIGIVLFMILSSHNNFQKKEYLPAEYIEKDVISSITKGKEYEENVQIWAKKQAPIYANNLEINYIHSSSSDISKKSSKTDPVKYLITGVNTSDINIFLSSFYTETIIQDLSNVRLDERIKTLKDIMNKISRNGTLKGVYLENKMGIFNFPSNEMKLTFVYKDNIKATVEIELVPIEESHGTHTQHYVIITSLWDIVKSIETALN